MRPLTLPAHLAKAASGPDRDPGNPLFVEVGRNALKGRLRCIPMWHNATTQASWPRWTPTEGKEPLYDTTELRRSATAFPTSSPVQEYSASRGVRAVSMLWVTSDGCSTQAPGDRTVGTPSAVQVAVPPRHPVELRRRVPVGRVERRGGDERHAQAQRLVSKRRFGADNLGERERPGGRAHPRAPSTCTSTGGQVRARRGLGPGRLRRRSQPPTLPRDSSLPDAGDRRRARGGLHATPARWNQ